MQLMCIAKQAYTVERTKTKVRKYLDQNAFIAHVLVWGASVQANMRV